MYFDIEETVVSIVTFCIGALILFLFLFLLVWSFPRIGYHFNKSTCSVWIDSKEVYSGKCHYVTVEPVGEYGKSKRVRIYKDMNLWHLQQEYISENVEMKEVK